MTLKDTDLEGAVLVTGGTGFLGSALVSQLCARGRHVIVLSRDAQKARLQLGDGVRVVGSLADIAPATRISAMVHLAGARVLGLPWTAARRSELVASRTRICAQLVELAGRLEQRPAVLVAASAVGYYGVPAEGVICDEHTPPMPGVFQSDLCAAAEREARRAEPLGLRVVRMRLGVVLGREGGAYPMQALAARLGMGARLGSGQQPMPWIHQDDAVGLLLFALDTPGISGPVNAVAPEVCTQAAFTRALAASWGRRAWLQMPAAPLRLLAGEMSTLLLDGQAVVPRRALELGWHFRFARLDDALRSLAVNAA